ncbi:efflux RND transporter periplasmic adaptor subunit [Rhizobium paknamense]|uniref:Multidrug efflux system membrane fusion protein n=1 Tax=Rhizobium paknamense TaxID=1206817 RepID=A0ABU0IHK9_9HYPH|nr:efflux RND transporter periplasmic adaptor subunit [Rhizobium paknamense]MDQ0457758.1 multidrug efflux system membrane fusion protein [Rhizobium paknamense]
MTFRYLPHIIIASVTLGAGFYFLTLKSEANSSRPVDVTPTAIAVKTAKVLRQDMPIYMTGIGTVQPYESVQVKSQVTGQIVELHFQEGQDVKAGDVLAVIDQRSLQAQLRQAIATRDSTAAQLADAKVLLARRVALKDFASQETVTTQQAQVQKLEAQLAADNANIDAAQTSLDQTVIRSPIDGRAGIRQIDNGNIVHATDTTPIVTINQLKPVSVSFTLQADDLPAVLEGQVKAALPVTAFDRGNRRELVSGTLSTIDNQIDTATGTVKLKATFTNDPLTLWPGQFVNVRLQAGSHKGGLVVPEAAVQQGPQGLFVWVVDGDGKAHNRQITVIDRLKDLASVSGQIAEGDSVVIDGAYNLREGSLVKTAPEPKSTAPIS